MKDSKVGSAPPESRGLTRGCQQQAYSSLPGPCFFLSLKITYEVSSVRKYGVQRGALRTLSSESQTPGVRVP